MIGRLLTPPQFTLVRHGQTSYNAAHRLNGDPAVAVHLDDLGRAQCVERAIELRDQPFDLAVHTPFVRTQESLDILLAGRDVPRVCIAQLGDVRLGVFEGRPVRDYRLWRTGRSAATWSRLSVYLSLRVMRCWPYCTTCRSASSPTPHTATTPSTDRSPT